jgi:hypothetical protein
MNSDIQKQLIKNKQKQKNKIIFPKKIIKVK